MKARKTLAAGLAFALLVMLTLTIGEGSGTKATVPQDVTIDVGQLTDGRCTYWAPAPPGQETSGGGAGDAINEREDVMGGPLSHLLEHSGFWPQVSIDEPDAVSTYFACTDAPDEGEAPCQSVDCFLRGEHYIMLKMADPEELSDGCIRYNIKGLRTAAVISTIDGGPQSFLFLSDLDDAVHMVCGLGDGRVLKMRMMACPDMNGDRVIDLFEDVLPAAMAIGQTRDDPDWNYQADVNEDGVVDLFNDIFTVLYHFGIDCLRFNY